LVWDIGFVLVIWEGGSATQKTPSIPTFFPL